MEKYHVVLEVNSGDCSDDCPKALIDGEIHIVTCPFRNDKESCGNAWMVDFDHDFEAFSK